MPAAKVTENIIIIATQPVRIIIIHEFHWVTSSLIYVRRALDDIHRFMSIGDTIRISSSGSITINSSVAVTSTNVTRLRKANISGRERLLLDDRNASANNTRRRRRMDVFYERLARFWRVNITVGGVIMSMAIMILIDR